MKRAGLSAFIDRQELSTEELKENGGLSVQYSTMACRKEGGIDRVSVQEMGCEMELGKEGQCR